jgi:hypothetical protein
MRTKVRRCLPAMRRAFKRYTFGSAMISDETGYVVVGVTWCDRFAVIEFRQDLPEDAICHLIGCSMALAEHHKP